MTKNRPYRFIISGGGTGGHIYPALAVANEIKAREKDAEILFVGAKGKMEMTKVPEAGYPIKGLWISGLQRRVTLENLYFPLKVISSFLSAKKILKSFQPDAVIGFGGYASGPVMMAANSKRLPAMIQEQNSYAGLTNKKLGAKAAKVCVAYDGMEQYFPKEKIKLTGNPVRSDILSLQDKRAKAFEHFKLDPDKPCLLILGGSLGAKTINNSVLARLPQAIHKGVQLIWQTGKFYYHEMTSAAKNYDLTNVRILEFIKEVDLAYAAADVVISRAGALSISELCLVGKPVIFVPSPNVAEDHQTKNARALTKKGAAILVKDSNAKKDMIPTALELLSDKERRKILSGNIKLLGKPKATEDIVNELMEMIK
ncbi:MAG: undecaprenyldiphospho-muramoylpentapeptide beta-N-acetylglucosaminyltransferase [Bacteroidota bacterium]